MALKFSCPNCSETIIVKYLRPGEMAVCRKCNAKVKVPEQCEMVDDSVAPVSSVPPQVTRVSKEPVRSEYEYLASRWKRLFGTLIDSIVVGLPALILMIPHLKENYPTIGTENEFVKRYLESEQAILLIPLNASYIAIQVILLVRRGQTIGKLLLGTRIVDLSNSHPEWWRLIIIRQIFQILSALKLIALWINLGWMSALDILFNLVFFLDAVFIFRHDKRTIHDLLAGTKVIDKNKYSEWLALREQ